MRTLVVSWKDAAETKDSVARDAFVIPNKRRLNLAGIPPFEETFLFCCNTSDSSSWSPMIKSVSPDSVTSTFLSICLRIHSMCLSLISTP